jgi:hypothetical protein
MIGELHLDLDALAGWAITAVLLMTVVAMAWYRRWRRDPAGFRQRLGQTTPGATTPGSSTHQRPNGRV